jgi:hypothetical protein
MGDSAFSADYTCYDGKIRQSVVQTKSTEFVLMPTYPDYVYQTLARDAGQWYCGQSDAAALCFDVLALFPEYEEAQDLVCELFCDEWTIYDNRVVIQRNMDE